MSASELAAAVSAALSADREGFQEQAEYIDRQRETPLEGTSADWLQ